MKRAAVLLLAASIMLPICAQGSRGAPKIVGMLKDVEGFVFVVISDQSINAYSGAALVVGTRVVTTATGSVTLAFENGCNVKLTPNQTMVIKDIQDCAALLAAPVATAPVVAAPVAGATIGLGAGAGVGLVLGGLAAINVILDNQNKNKVSGD